MELLIIDENMLERSGSIKEVGTPGELSSVVEDTDVFNESVRPWEVPLYFNGYIKFKHSWYNFPDVRTHYRKGDLAPGNTAD